MALSDATVSLLRISSSGYLSPILRTRMHGWVDMMTARGHDPRVIETLRLPALQAEYFRRGTSKQRDVLRSMHGHGLAFDAISISRGWSFTAEWKADAVECATACGLVCGGTWKSPVDWPHFQPIEVPGVVPDRLVAAFNAGGIAASWAAAALRG